jgi:quinolinate synthase
MAMNGLRNLVAVLETGNNEIVIEESVRARALIPLQRMLDFATSRKVEVVGNA